MLEQFAHMTGALSEMTGGLAMTRAPQAHDKRNYRFSKRSNNPGAVGESAVLEAAGEAATAGPAGLAADTALAERNGGKGVRAAMGVMTKGGSGERGAMGVMALGVDAASEVGTAMVIDLPASSPSSFLTATPLME